MTDKKEEHRPTRYGIEKTETGGSITFIMQDGIERKFHLHLIDMAGIRDSLDRLLKNLSN